VLSIALRLAVIALILYAGVTFWYGRVEERLQEQIPAPQKEAAQVPVQEVEQAAQDEDDYQIILTRNIFKTQSGDQPQTDVDDLAETRLQLVLLGTVTGEKDDARAIIRDETTNLENLYQVGSEVQGAVIGRITRGKVVLQHNGREEVLTIKDPESNDQGPGASPGMTTGAVDRAPDSPGAELENKVPEAQPRRRVTFRNSGSTPPVNDQPPEEEQVQTDETPPPRSDDEVPVRGAGEEQAAEQPGQ
jgi:type II secretory pathway component PulC